MLAEARIDSVPEVTGTDVMAVPDMIGAAKTVIF
jgi:hypothetical protein